MIEKGEKKKYIKRSPGSEAEMKDMLSAGCFSFDIVFI